MDRAKKSAFDLMVFDAPATGQGLAFFKVPRMAMSMTRVGPLHAMAERMWRLLADPELTALNIVTLPEEMSVSESIDLHLAAETIGLPHGVVIVNGVNPDVLPGDLADLRRIFDEARPADGLDGRVTRAVLAAAVASGARREAQEEMIGKLAAVLPQPRVILPFVLGPRIGLDAIETLATHLEASEPTA